MCLQNVGEKKIASKDIVVYKLVKKLDHKIDLNANGKPFTGIIKGHKVSGVISIENDIYFCTDEEELNGQRNRYKYGYKYSWILDHHVNMKSIEVEGRRFFGKGFTLVTMYREVVIELGEIYTSNLEVLLPSQESYRRTKDIEIGLHSYVNKLTALYYSKAYLNLYMVKCIIPKGSTYYEGTFNDYPSIASDTLRYGKRLIKPKNN
jgi:hypothetical protein